MKNLIIIFAVLFAVGCQKAAEVKIPEPVGTKKTPAAEQPNLKTSPTDSSAEIDVPKLANLSVAEIDKMFGAPAQANDVENGGKYRLYKSAAHQKGLAIRFYDGKAKSFNLILDQPENDSKAAILKNLGIDVGNAKPLTDKTEPLTENFQGTFGGVKFAKVSAKRQETGKGFIFVFAEVGQ